MKQNRLTDKKHFPEWSSAGLPTIGQYRMRDMALKMEIFVCARLTPARSEQNSATTIKRIVNVGVSVGKRWSTAASRGFERGLTLTWEAVPIPALSWSLPADPGRPEPCKSEPVMHRHEFYPWRPVRWPRRRFQWWSLSLGEHHHTDTDLSLCRREKIKNKRHRTVPFVSLYISLTVFVDMSLRGCPLSPPVSHFWGSCSTSGRETVVLDTIKPSTPSCKQNKIKNHKCDTHVRPPTYMSSAITPPRKDCGENICPT